MSGSNSHDSTKLEDCGQINLIDKIKLYRTLREHEDNVMNHRMVWMWTLQALLFAAFSVIWEKGNIGPLVTICFVGLFSCISIGYSQFCSQKALEDMEKKGENILKKVDLIENGLLEVVLGRPPISVHNIFLPWKLLPWIMGCAWVGFIIFAVIYCQPK